MSKSLIVYFSHNKENYFSGNIVNLEKGNVQVIADYHECTSRASEELKNNARPQILDPLESIDEYDTIYLGYPNWWSTMPTIVMTFLESYDFTNKHIYPICSHEGSGMGRSESNLKKLCPNSIVHKGLSIHGSHVGECRQQLERWVGGK